MTIRYPGNDDEINEIANAVQDLKTDVEELQTNPSLDIDPGTLDRVKSALEDAADATNELEDQQEIATAPRAELHRRAADQNLKQRRRWQQQRPPIWHRKPDVHREVGK